MRCYMAMDPLCLAEGDNGEWWRQWWIVHHVPSKEVPCPQLPWRLLCKWDSCYTPHFSRESRNLDFCQMPQF